MEARAEGLPGIDLHDGARRLIEVHPLPRRNDDDLADALRSKMLPPGFIPRGIGHALDYHSRTRQRATQRRAQRFDAFSLAVREPRPQYRRTVVDRRAAQGIGRSQRFGNDELRGRFRLNGDFEPGAHSTPNASFTRSKKLFSSSTWSPPARANSSRISR